MPIPTPFASQPVKILSEWCKADGAMANAYYGVVFDRCADGALELVGLGPAYVQARGLSFYTAEAHVCFVRPVHALDEVVVTFQLIDYDEKRIRTYQEMRHVDGWLAATSEILSLHVDLSMPKVTPFPADVRAKIEQMAAAHATLARPSRAGKHIELS
ncbi:thioesterase family protein [Mesorhizobium sp.]|uniref:thioesterase family protein n=1 Tax=Mesorhizobium sp. TaxID=1871066 RepID=UPI000FE82285|nr:thioesterase family protein [Mesorhizobium sp.]RWB66317.1 MAG: thioesterase [Mesorhizobium sp.]